jgi:soluble lytic murein transglycosylase-like protein
VIKLALTAAILGAITLLVLARTAQAQGATKYKHSIAFYKYAWTAKHKLWRAEKQRRVRAERRLVIRFKRDVEYAFHLAGDLFGIPLNLSRGVSEGELRSVSYCETGGTFNPFAKNRSSSASGMMQFLDSTWANQGLPRFSVFDPIANILAAARIVAGEGWHQWACKP